MLLRARRADMSYEGLIGTSRGLKWGVRKKSTIDKVNHRKGRIKSQLN
jgi:hypothetical protein